MKNILQLLIVSILGTSAFCHDFWVKASNEGGD